MTLLLFFIDQKNRVRGIPTMKINESWKDSQIESWLRMFKTFF